MALAMREDEEHQHQHQHLVEDHIHHQSMHDGPVPDSEVIMNVHTMEHEEHEHQHQHQHQHEHEHQHQHEHEHQHQLKDNEEESLSSIQNHDISDNSLHQTQTDPNTQQVFDQTIIQQQPHINSPAASALQIAMTVQSTTPKKPRKPRQPKSKTGENGEPKQSKKRKNTTTTNIIHTIETNENPTHTVMETSPSPSNLTTVVAVLNPHDPSNNSSSSTSTTTTTTSSPSPSSVHVMETGEELFLDSNGSYNLLLPQGSIHMNPNHTTLVQNGQAEVHKKGKWSKAEDSLLHDTILNFLRQHGIDETYGMQNLFTGQKLPEFRGCWTYVSKALPHRSHEAVYEHARTRFERPVEKGEWKPEDCEKLVDLVKEHGKKWAVIAKELGRRRVSCRDKYREVSLGSDRQKGMWSDEEVERLREILKKNLGDSYEERWRPGGIPWDAVAQEMKTRDKYQCIAKWEKMCRKQRKSEVPALLPHPQDVVMTTTTTTTTTTAIIPSEHGTVIVASNIPHSQVPIVNTHWTLEHDKRMLEWLYQQGVQDESEVLWAELSKRWEYRWTPNELRCKWLSLRRRGKDKNEGRAMSDIIAELLQEVLVMIDQGEPTNTPSRYKLSRKKSATPNTQAVLNNLSPTTNILQLPNNQNNNNNININNTHTHTHTHTHTLNTTLTQSPSSPPPPTTTHTTHSPPQASTDPQQVLPEKQPPTQQEMHGNSMGQQMPNTIVSVANTQTTTHNLPAMLMQALSSQHGHSHGGQMVHSAMAGLAVAQAMSQLTQLTASSNLENPLVNMAPNVQMTENRESITFESPLGISHSSIHTQNNGNGNDVMNKRSTLGLEVEDSESFESKKRKASEVDQLPIAFQM